MTLRSGRKKKRPRSIERTPSKRQKMMLNEEKSAMNDDDDDSHDSTEDENVEMDTVIEEDEEMNDTETNGDNDELMDEEEFPKDPTTNGHGESATIPPSNAFMSPPAPVATSATTVINLRLPSDQTPQRLSRPSTLPTPETLNTHASTINQAGSSVPTTSLFPGSKSTGVAYSGSTRLNDFETPIKPKKAMNGESSHTEQNVSFQPPPTSAKDVVESKIEEAESPPSNVNTVLADNTNGSSFEQEEQSNGHGDIHHGIMHIFRHQTSFIHGIVIRLRENMYIKNIILYLFQDNEAIQIKLAKFQTWILLFVACHFILSIGTNGWLVKPLWQSLPEKSTSRLNAYKSSFGFDIGNFDEIRDPVILEQEVEVEAPIQREPPELIKEQIQEIIEFDDNLGLEKQERELLKKRKLLSEYQQYTTIVHESIGNIESTIMKLDTSDKILRMYESELQNILKMNGRLKLHDKLQAWDSVLIQAEALLEESLNAKEKEIEEDENVMYQMLQTKLTSLVELSHGILDIDDTKMLLGDNVDVPIEEKRCQDDIVTNQQMSSPQVDDREQQSSRVTQKMLDTATNELTSLSFSTIDQLKQDVELIEPVRKWIRNIVQTVKSETVPTTSNEDFHEMETQFGDMADDFEVDGLSKGALTQIIYTRLEQEKVNSGGKFDYAGLSYGATVIRTGIRRTSHSLVEDMPLINRAAAALNLRFYGHKPEAALMPTFPRTALGQCWSFEDDKLRKKLTIDIDGTNEVEEEAMKNDPDRGDIATLAVRLSKPIHIKSVSIEHPSANLSSATDTAIRLFRVTGYEDEDTTGRPWVLGSFEYVTGGDSVQDFVVENTEGGLRIPKLSSVVLAIDSNWGGEYSCLYRFRVHDS